MVPVRQPGSCCAGLACFLALEDSRTVLEARPGRGRGNNPVRQLQARLPTPDPGQDRQRDASPLSTIRRTGRLEPSIAFSSSAFATLPPQPSWRMRSRMSRISMSLWGMCVSEIIRSLPQRSHTMRRNQLGKARSGSSRASAPDGSGSRYRNCASAVGGLAWGASGAWRPHHGGDERLDLGRGLLAIVGFLAAQDILSRLLAAVTIAGPVIPAAWAFLRGGRFGRWT
jgi:hypothetical protein